MEFCPVCARAIPEDVQSGYVCACKRMGYCHTAHGVDQWIDTGSRSHADADGTVAVPDRATFLDPSAKALSGATVLGNESYAVFDPEQSRKLREALGPLIEITRNLPWYWRWMSPERRQRWLEKRGVTF